MTSALERLRSFDRWVAWTYRQRGKGKPTKPPVNPHTGRVASVADPATWGTYEQARARADADNLPGVGYVLTPDDGITGADLDRVRNPETGELVEWAREIVALAETYCEVSPSGTGLRLFFTGKLERAIKNDEHGIEIYGDGRYLTITGKRVEGCPDEIREAPRTLAALLARVATSASENDREPGEAQPKANGKGNGKHKPDEDDEFYKLNQLALRSLDAWVPDLFPGQVKKSGRGYRVPSKALGRDLQEDVSITVDGIVDFGVHDIGDERKGKRSAIGLVMEHNQSSFDDSVTWLCTKLGVKRPGVVLDPNAPIKTARALMHSRFTTEDGLPLLWRHREQSWIYKDNYYRAVGNETLETSIWRFLEHAKRNGERGPKPFNPKREHVSNVLAALSAVSQLEEFLQPPLFLRDRDMPPGKEFLACANGLLHLPTQTLYPATPDFFSLSASGVTYDPDARPPERWLSFLTETVQDEESIQTLQDWIGYTLSTDTSLQKMLLCWGPGRAGKGTTSKIMRALLGGDNSVAAPMMANLGEQFGLEELISKPLAIISDARIGGKTDNAVVVERLLSITGEDVLSVPRKFKGAWTGRLATRFVIMTNEMPSFTEGSGALAKRFIVISFKQSFYGREDPELEGKLMLELPGILNWAIEGYQRLRERRRLIQPRDTMDLTEQMEMLGSPVKAFLRDKCTVGPGLECLVDSMYEEWKQWSLDDGRRNPGSKEWFGRNLHSAVPGLRIKRTGAGGMGGRMYLGVALADDGSPGGSF